MPVFQQKKKKSHHNYKDYDKVEDDYSQIWMPLKDDKDRHCDRSPLSPYNSPDEDQEFGSLSRGDPGDRDQRRRMSGDRSEWRFNNSQGNRNRGCGGRNNRGRDRDRCRDRDRGDRDKDCGGSKRRNSREGYRSPPGPYDSPSDEDYDEDSR